MLFILITYKVDRSWAHRVGFIPYTSGIGTIVGLHPFLGQILYNNNPYLGVGACCCLFVLRCYRVITYKMDRSWAHRVGFIQYTKP